MSALVTLLRMKVAAVLLGPAGLGLIALLQSIVATAGVLATGGLDHAATRQLATASAHHDQRALAIAWRALSIATLVLAASGAAGIWLLREEIATLMLGDRASAAIIGWLGIAVACSVVSSSQTALLNGLTRVGDLAKSNVAGALIATVLAVASLVAFGSHGVMLFVLSAPVASALASWWFVRKLSRPREIVRAGDMMAEWWSLARLGAGLMIVGLLASLCQLFIRAQLQHVIGTNAVGQYQAAWTLSMQFGALVLAGLGADYYPRLTGKLLRHENAEQYMNDQVQVVLLIGAPACLLIAGTAPWIVPIFFSSDFGEAARVLQLQVLGDILRLAITPCIYVLWASGRVERILLIDGSTYLLMGLLTMALLPTWGILSVGAAYLFAHMSYAGMTLAVVRGRFSYRLGLRNAVHLSIILIACTLVVATTACSGVVSLGISLLGACLAILYACHRFDLSAWASERLRRVLYKGD